jgi:hypothetical protein
MTALRAEYETDHTLPFSVGSDQRRRLRLVKPAQANSTFRSTDATWPDWLDKAVQDIERSSAGREVSGSALLRCLNWIFTLPNNLRAPEISVGEDGTISLEWDSRGNVLNILFDDRGDEWYFEPDGGESVEDRLESQIDRLSEALQTSAR